MPLKESYVIWNNKGGVGKSSLTFHMSSRYAEQNPSKSVLVIDLCPQANVSMALLHSEENHGSTQLSELYRKNKTISFYLLRSLESEPTGEPTVKATVKARDFLTQAHTYNDQLPENLFLLCGDMDLELVGRHLDHLRSGSPLPTNNPWLNITSSILNFIKGSPQRIDGVTEGEADWVVFIDTNSAFAVYTEIALAAARKLLIPINADDFSVQAVRAMLDLVYGIRREGEQALELFKAYRESTFSYKAELYGLRRPEIHLLINNRATAYATRSARAFSAMGDENLKVLFEAYGEHQQQKRCFSQQVQQIPDVQAFKQIYYVDVHDFHTTAILCLHTGCPLGKLKGKVTFDEADLPVTVDKTCVAQYLRCLDELIQKL